MPVGGRETTTSDKSEISVFEARHTEYMTNTLSLEFLFLFFVGNPHSELA